MNGCTRWLSCKNNTAAFQSQQATIARFLISLLFDRCRCRIDDSNRASGSAASAKATPRFLRYFLQPQQSRASFMQCLARVASSSGLWQSPSSSSAAYQAARGARRLAVAATTTLRRQGGSLEPQQQPQREYPLQAAAAHQMASWDGAFARAACRVCFEISHQCPAVLLLRSAVASFPGR